MSESTGMLKRGVHARRAKAVFFRQVNDLDIFVEDSSPGMQKLYAVLVGRALGSQIEVSKVFPLGSRIDVIAAATSDTGGRGRRRVYLVDGDAGVVDSSPDPIPTGLFVLPRYCIENYLCCVESLLEVMEEEDVNRDIHAIRASARFNHWMEESLPLLVRLHCAFLAARKLGSSLGIAPAGMSGFVRNSGGDVSAEKVDAHVVALKESVPKEVQGRFEDMFSELVRRVEAVDQQGLRAVSGKTFLFPMFLLRARNEVRLRSPNPVIALRVAKRVDVGELAVVWDRVRRD